MEHIYQPGDPCDDCQQLGLSNRLRYFYINLEEQILKCESDSCIFPYVDPDFSDEVGEALNGEQVLDSEQQTFTPLQSFVDGGVQLIDELLKETPLTADRPIVYNYDFSHMAPPNSDKPNLSQGVDSVDYALCSPVPAQSLKSEAASESSVKTESDCPVTQSTATGTATSSNDIPKAHISRFLAALKSPLSGLKADPQPRHRPTKKGPKRLRHQLVIAETPAAPTRNPKVAARPLDLVQQLVANKTKH